MKSVNPTNGKTITEYTPWASSDVSETLDRCHEAFESWRTTSFDLRASILRKTADLLEDQKESLSLLMTNEMGKTLKEGRSEIEKCALVCRYYADNGEKFLSPQPLDTDYQKSYATFQPIGCILAVMPWNFPFWQVFRFAAPTLMAGNTGLLKHASNVTGCALAIENIFKEAGLPESIFTTLLADKDAALRLIENPKIRAVTLTGSTKAGKAVAAKAGEFLKKTVLELGGSDAYLILEDADIEQAAKLCSQSRLLNSGQSCIAAKRFIVHKNVSKEFTEKMVQIFKDKIVGDPLDEKTDLGPMARTDLRDELHQQVQNSIERGATCLTGGKLPDENSALSKGAYYPPTILANVKKGMPAFDEEMFGPVAAIIVADSEEQAIELANDCEFGLGGGVFTKNLQLGEDIAAFKMDTGACFVNDFVKSDPRLPFGGVKNSGYGRELSDLGIKEFVNIKTVCVKA